MGDPGDLATLISETYKNVLPVSFLFCPIKSQQLKTEYWRMSFHKHRHSSA